MSNKKRISKLLKLKYKVKRYFKSTWPARTPKHFIDALRHELMKDYPLIDFKKEYLNLPVPEKPITFIPEERFPAIPINRHLYVF